MRVNLVDYCAEMDRTELLQQGDDQHHAMLFPETITCGSRRMAWRACGHGWKGIIYSRAGPQKSGCPVWPVESVSRLPGVSPRAKGEIPFEANEMAVELLLPVTGTPQWPTHSPS